jgi:hypothetical protein
VSIPVKAAKMLKGRLIHMCCSQISTKAHLTYCQLHVGMSQRNKFHGITYFCGEKIENIYLQGGANFFF